MSTTTTVKLSDPDDLNRFAEFDSPFRINDDGTVTRNLEPHIYGPSVYTYVDDDGQEKGPEEIDGTGWTPVTGYSGQQGYKGPVMHPSEQLAGGMARELLTRPGVYVVTSVECVNDQLDIEHEPAGWMLLKYTA